MRSTHIPGIAIIAVSLAVSGSVALAAQDRFTLTVPNGVAFSEIKGYETWQDVAVSQPFPEGSALVKIEWSKRKNPVSPYPVQEPPTLTSVALIEKDYKPFPETNSHGTDASFAKNEPPGQTRSHCGYLRPRSRRLAHGKGARTGGGLHRDGRPQGLHTHDQG